MIKQTSKEKGIFAAMVIIPSGRNRQQRESTVSVNVMCASASLLPAITPRVGPEFKLFGMNPALDKSCLVDRYYVPSASKTTSLKPNSRA